MKNAHPKLLLNEMREFYPDVRIRPLERYCANYVRWRKAIGFYMGFSDDEAKIELTKVFYGARPSAELPFLMKLHTQCGATGAYM